MAGSGSNDDDGDAVDEVDVDDEGVQHADDKDSTKDSACWSSDVTWGRPTLIWQPMSGRTIFTVTKLMTMMHTHSIFD